MATLSASSGQILSSDGTTPVAPQNPYNTYVSNMANLLQYVTKASATGGAAQAANIQGLQAGQAALATPGGASNPSAINSLYAFLPGSAQNEVSKSLGDIMNPAILSNQNQAAQAAQNSGNLTNEINASVNAYTSMNPVGRYSTGQFPGTLQMYSFDSRTGTYTDQNGNPINPPAGFTPPQGDALINGTDWGSYNGGGDVNYNKEMQTSFSTLQSAMPQGFGQTNADGTLVADGILKQYKSPITSSMIQQAATTYGIDPMSLMANAFHETQYGTDGAGLDDNNPGGVSANGKVVSYDTMMAGLNAEARTIAMYTPGNKLYSSSAPTTQSTGATDPIATQAQLVVNNQKSYSDAVSAVSGVPSGNLALDAAIKKLNPAFNFNQSGGVSGAQAANSQQAGTLQPLVDATNGIINGQPAQNGQSSVPSITTLYNNLPAQAQTSSFTLYNLAKGAADAFGDAAGQTAIQQWEGAVSELRAKAESVLLQAANLGISVGGDTASSLFSNNISAAGLAQSIARVQGYENQMISSLKNGGSQNTIPLTPSSNTSALSSGTGGDYQSYLKAIGM